MSITRRSFAKLAFAATALAAFAFTAARTVGADEIGFLSFEVIGHTETSTILRADVTPMMNGQPMMVRFGAEPYTGNYVGGTMAHTGTNIFAVSNPHKSGWYTAECAGKAIDTSDDQIGIN